MDLDLKEVSELLSVPCSTLELWVKEGKIPVYMIQDQYRFNREEVENFILQQTLKEDQNKRHSGAQAFNLFRALHNGDVYSDIRGNDKRTIIEAVTKRLSEKLDLDPEVLHEAIMEREELMPCAIGCGFAIPHTRDLLLQGQHDVVACIFLPEPIDYGALDGEKVHTLFFLLACNDKRHLSLLAKIAHLVANPEMQKFLATKPAKEKLLETIRLWEQNLNAS